MPEVHTDAPGRVNLIGDHTDYHDGFVLPCAIPQRTRVTLTTRGDQSVRLVSADVPGSFEYELGRELRRGAWGDYIQGLTWVLRGSGSTLSGFEVRVNSDVPVGSGLSSSAALEVAVLRALRCAFDLPLDDVELARLAQRAEVEFVGAPVGIMDQMASSLADERAALFLDTRTLAYEPVPLPSRLELLVIDSGVAHQHAGGGYSIRRRESEEAARLLGVTKLRDASEDALHRTAELPELLARRARHVITENARVPRAAAALRRGDLHELGRLFHDSHASLRDDYEVSVPAVNALVEMAEAEGGVYGARMTGGGFGGAIVVAAAAGEGRRIADVVSRRYSSKTGRAARVLVPSTR